MVELQEVKEDEPVLSKIEFEPSDFYVHDMLKFKCKHASLRDKVKSFNEASEYWEGDKFLTNCHGKLTAKSGKSREGRKLKIAEYHKKMEHKPL